MKPVSWMVGLSLISWLGIAGLVGRQTAVAALAGMLAPLAVASGTWILMERTYRRSPDGLTRLILQAFAGQDDILRSVRGGRAERVVDSSDSVHRQLHRVFHRSACNGSAVSAAAPRGGPAIMMAMFAALAQAHAQPHPAHAARTRRPRPPRRGSTPAKTIIGHVANSGIDHPLIHFPKVFGIDFSVTKHVFMLWVVAAIVFVVVTVTVRRYLRQDRRVPSGLMNGLEAVVEFIRDSIVQPNVGRKWVNTWTPLVLTFFVFILCANAVGLIPDLRGSRARRPLRAPQRRGLVPQAAAARRHDRDRQLQRDRRARDDHLRRDHRRRHRRRTGSSSTGRTSSRTAWPGRSTSS